VWLSRVTIGFLVTAALAGSAKAGEWRTVAPLPHPRWFHMAGVGSDGQLYAYGGYVRAGGRREYGVGEYAIDILDSLTGDWVRGPADTSIRYEAIYRKLKGHLDEYGKVRREVMREHGPATFKFQHEIPAGRADPLGIPRWPAASLWVPFDTKRRKWGVPSVAIDLPSLDPNSHDSSWKTSGPAWYRYTPTLATSADGLVYITGGSARPYREGNARPEISAAVEVWDARTNEWRELAPMRHARKLHAAAVDRRGRLFVFGGSEANVSTTRTDDETRESFERRARENEDKAATSLASVEMYDPETKRWSERAPMPIPRQAMGADVGADGRIYVVGGAPSYTHPRPMAVVEIYDPERDSWETGPSLRYRRRSHAVVATPDGRIYAIGGFVGPRERTLRQRLTGDFIEADLGATVEVLDTRPEP